MKVCEYLKKKPIKKHRKLNKFIEQTLKKVRSTTYPGKFRTHILLHIDHYIIVDIDLLGGHTWCSESFLDSLVLVEDKKPLFIRKMFEHHYTSEFPPELQVKDNLLYFLKTDPLQIQLP
jgi:hypothetical protein